ncbi:coiled-coil domain-containing protein 42 homolog [Pollicipes pollicipes]|uniref:coiled-coil domain-containing protein 42 homolog n=1 Tax=Pollicipes pollicipes TaxID=41117 RepID=UPI001884E418|nr:coiled-coil domain-containing protein 42 homolog [Pollicipes pollicipes]
MKKSENMMRDLEDYFRIRFENKIAIRPRREDCHLAAATRLLARKQELSEVEGALGRRKTWYQLRMQEISDERAILEEREKGLKTSLLKFDKFLKENDSKRHRALKKVEEEQGLQLSKDREIAKLTEDLQELNEFKGLTQETVDRNKLFQDFMEKAVEATEEYEEVHDVMNRYDILSVTKEYLMRREQGNQDLVEDAKLELIQYSEDRNTEILGLNNRLSELQSRYDKAQQAVITWENTWTRIKNTAAKKTLLLGQVKMAIHNLYQLCNRYRLSAEEVTACYDPNAQLDRIREVLEDLVFVSGECRRNEQQLQQETAAQASY